MGFVASLLPLLCFLLFPLAVNFIEPRRPSLSALMSRHRLRWVANAVRRDTPLDAILSGNLMGSVSFFASTTVLIVLALFAVFGQLQALRNALALLQPELAPLALEVHLIGALVLFVLAFLAFTLSLRQFNHFCIMLGAVDQAGGTPVEEVRAIAELNSQGARNFNHGIRAYYFSIATLAWFASPLLSLLATAVIIGVLVHREFYSAPRDLIARLESSKLQV